MCSLVDLIHCNYTTNGPNNKLDLVFTNLKSNQYTISKSDLLFFPKNIYHAVFEITLFRSI